MCIVHSNVIVGVFVCSVYFPSFLLVMSSLAGPLTCTAEHNGSEEPRLGTTGSRYESVHCFRIDAGSSSLPEAEFVMYM